MQKKAVPFLLFVFVFTSILNTLGKYPKREFRGVWLATVSNIDWPSAYGLPMVEQQEELLNILETHKHNNLNAIFLQVRPAADAFYAKSREPWSFWLTGKQGVAPHHFYDPLAFAIEEAHKRGIELHAWFNPYRAVFSNEKSDISPQHITCKKPEWFFNYEGKKLFNPGIPEVRNYIVQVILDVVRHYDIDGIHLDDYFYPYPIKGQIINDIHTFKKYNNGFTNLEDWRRNNVDLLIKTLADSIHAYKPHIKFGISPFGIWKNKKQDPLGSETNGLSSYYSLYADVRKWLKNNWIDYVAPQIYFSFKSQAAPFSTLTDWWSENIFDRHLYIGHGVYKLDNVTPNGWKTATELLNQIRYTRKNSEIGGSIFFSSNSVIRNLLGISDSLKATVYKMKALPPVMPWLDNIPPNPPEKLTATKHHNHVQLNWKEGDPSTIGYVIYRFEEGEKISIEDAKNIIQLVYTKQTSYEDFDISKKKKYVYIVTALDATKNESDASITIKP